MFFHLFIWEKVFHPYSIFCLVVDSCKQEMQIHGLLWYGVPASRQPSRTRIQWAVPSFLRCASGIMSNERHSRRSVRFVARVIQKSAVSWYISLSLCQQGRLTGRHKWKSRNCFQANGQAIPGRDKARACVCLSSLQLNRNGFSWTRHHPVRISRYCRQPRDWLSIRT